MKLLSSWRRPVKSSSAKVQISEKSGVRYLHLGSSTIQSGMRLAAPDELVLAYTRSMMSFMLFLPEPRRIITIGLGGGSVNKWLYRYLPRSRQVVVELNPQVIAVARQYFQVPADDERLQIIQADGAQWLANQPETAELVLVDGYDGVAQAEELATPEFYGSCARALSGNGVLVVNLWGSDRKYADYLQRIEAAFDGQVICVPALQKGNIIVLGFKRCPIELRWDELRERAKQLEATYGLEFVRFVEVMKQLNPHTDKRLLV